MEPSEFTHLASTLEELLVVEVERETASVSRLMPRHIWREEQLQ